MLYPFSRLCRPARSPANCGPALCRKRGFNLIESAVVLGIVGLVIGGIWVAASAVMERNKQTATLNMVVSTVEKIRFILKDVPAYSYPDSYDLTSLAVALDAIPSSQKTPYGDIFVWYETQFGGRDFQVNLRGINSSACFVLVSRLANGASVNGLTRIVIYPNTIDRRYTSFPIATSEINDKCQTTTGRVFFQFNY